MIIVWFAVPGLESSIWITTPKVLFSAIVKLVFENVRYVFSSGVNGPGSGPSVSHPRSNNAMDNVKMKPNTMANFE